MNSSRRFRFMLLNDMHLPEQGYPGARVRAEWAVECVRGEHGFEPVDFVIGAGDIVNGLGRGAAYVADHKYVQALVLDRLGAPYLPCLGNHETQETHAPDGYAAYDAQFGPGRRQYVFTCGGIAFVVIDACCCDPPPSEAWTRCNEFLRNALKRLAEQELPAIIVSHVPFVPVRDEDVYVKSFGFGPYYAVMDPETYAIVLEHADRVIAVLSGHIHLTGLAVRDGIYHVVISGAASYPSDVATFDVYEDRIDVQVHRAPEELQNRRADIHGRPRWDIDYTDSQHPDHESYMSGNPDERSFSIPLSRAKRPAGNGGLQILGSEV